MDHRATSVEAPGARFYKVKEEHGFLDLRESQSKLKIGDRVRIVETRPLSAKKRWRLLEVVERAR